MLSKTIAASDLVKDHQAAISAASELPFKKQKLEEYLGGLGGRVPFTLPVPGAALIPQQIYALDPVYLQRCLQEFNVRDHFSAFKPVAQSIKEQKLRSATALGLSARCLADPPLLQNPEKVVLMSESERFERSFQPNVALAPPTPKKHRYGRTHENSSNHIASVQQCSSSSTSGEEAVASVAIKVEPTSPSPLTNGHHIKEEADPTKTPPPTPPERKIDSTVSVLQTNNSIRSHHHPKYNPEIELSTDTEDSASETSEKHNNSDYQKLEEVLKSINNDDVKDKILELFRNASKERDRAILDISELERKNSELEHQNSDLKQELEKLKTKIALIPRDNIIKDTNSDLVTSSSIIVQAVQEKGGDTSPPAQQKSVIASVASLANNSSSSVPNSVANGGAEEGELIKNTAPE